MHVKLVIVALATSAMLGSSAWAQTPASSEGIGGLYAGSYLCEDGEHGVVLDLNVTSGRRGEG